MEFFRLFRRTLVFARSEQNLVVLFALTSFLIATAQMLEPILFGRVIDALSKQSSLFHYLSFWLALGLLNAALSVCLSVATDRFAHRQRMAAIIAGFDRSITLPARFHSQQGTGRSARTILAGSDQVFYVLLSLFRENLIAVSSVLVLIPLAFALDVRLASIIFALAIIYVSCNWFVIRQTQSRQIRVEVKHQDLAARLLDVIGNVAIVRSFSRAKLESNLFRDLASGVLRDQYPVLSWWGVFNVITRLSSMFSMMILVAVGSYMVSSGKVSGGQVVTFVGFSNLLIGRLDQISAFLNRIVGQAPTLRNLFALIDQVNADDAPKDISEKVLDNVPTDDSMNDSFGEGIAPIRSASRSVAQSRGQLLFENVTFRYQGNGQGVSNLNFAIDAGQTIAIVGPSGSGKTTLVSLLQRVLSPSMGRILIDGQNIQSLSTENLCQSIATVFQDPGLFNRSIYDNILVGRPVATRAEVEEAARRADAHEFILARPEGYGFVVGERGTALSGGERQRLAIARAILKDAPILVLDEATSALDNETEKRIQAAMEHLRAGKTTLVIAHRLSTVVSSDRILVLANGKLTESGTFSQLQSGNGLFSRLIRAGQLEDDSLTKYESTDRPKDARLNA